MENKDYIKISKGRAALLTALDELTQIRQMDNILAHAVRELRAIEDTLYQYTEGR